LDRKYYARLYGAPLIKIKKAGKTVDWLIDLLAIGKRRN
jgi:hypothetical protein